MSSRGSAPIVVVSASPSTTAMVGSGLPAKVSHYVNGASRAAAP